MANPSGHVPLSHFLLRLFQILEGGRTLFQPVFAHAPESSGPPMYRIKSFIQQDAYNKSRCLSI